MQGKSDCVFEVSLEDKNSPIVLKEKSFEMTKKFYIWILIKEKNLCSITILNKPDTILIGNVMGYDLKNHTFYKYFFLI